MSRRVWRRLSPALPACMLLLAGCDLINPDEQIPAYLRIEPFAYTPGMTDGPITSQVSDAWVYVDSKLLGVFELPVTIPVLHAGPTKVDILPGIYADGQKGARLIYPFYKQLATTINFVPKQITPLTPPTSFDDAITHQFNEVNEDFNSSTPGAVKFDLNAATGVGYQLQTNVRADPAGLQLQIPADFGGVGLVQGISGKTDVFYLDSQFYGFLPQRGAPVYLELDYRSSMPFKVGVAWNTTNNAQGANFTRNADLTLFAKPEWTKLYVNLTDEISYVNNSAAKFKLFIQGLPNGDAGQYLAIDNVRLVRKK